MIYCFSGTGNSLYAARIISDMSGDEVVSLNGVLKSGAKLISESSTPLVFVTPTHGWKIPEVVESLIRNAEFTGNRRAYFVMTCGTGTGNAGGHLKALCDDLSLEFMGLFSVKMPENYIAMFKVPEEEEAERIIRAAEPEIRRAAKIIMAGNKFPNKTPFILGRLESGIVNKVFCSHFIKDKAFEATFTCIRCGTCAELCPVNNIEMEDVGPRWLGNCMHCMACICGCPTEAIEYGKASIGKPRYFLTRAPERK